MHERGGEWEWIYKYMYLYNCACKCGHVCVELYRQALLHGKVLPSDVTCVHINVCSKRACGASVISMFAPV